MYVVTYCILCSLDSSVKNWKCFISFIVSLFFFCYERSSKLVCMQGIHYALFCFYCRNVIALFDVLLALGSLWAQREKIQHFLGIRFYSISLSCKNDICNLYLRWMGLSWFYLYLPSFFTKLNDVMGSIYPISSKALLLSSQAIVVLVALVRDCRVTYAPCLKSWDKYLCGGV